VDRRHEDGRVDLGGDETRPILLAVSDNGPQTTSGSTREFMALCAIAQHFGRPGTPTDQAWIESLNGHLKSEYPHLLAIRDPATLRAELAIARAHYNSVRLHQGVGYVTPNDEQEGRGEAIRKAREAGLEQARLHRLAWHRQHRHDQHTKDPDDVGEHNAILYREVRNTSPRRNSQTRRSSTPPARRCAAQRRKYAARPALPTGPTPPAAPGQNGGRRSSATP
jgi:hypothetical protein